MAAHVAAARPVSEVLSLGAGVKIIRQVIDDRSATGAALDLAALYHAKQSPLSAGLMVQHIGTPLRFTATAYDLPLTVRAGVAWRVNKKFLATADLVQPNDNYLSAAAGVEYLPVQLLALRAGYRYRLGGIELGDLTGFSAGMGINFRIASLQSSFDYAFVPYGVLGNAHRVSVRMLFDVPVLAAPDRPAPPPAAVHPAAIAPPALQARQSAAATNGFRHLTVTAQKTRASARTLLYVFSATSATGIVRQIDGRVKAGANNQFTLSVHEQAEPSDPDGRALHITFRHTMPAEPWDISCTVAIPATLAPAVFVSGGREVAAELLSYQGAEVLYRITLNTLTPLIIKPH
jgi:hypothetical protein